MFANTQMMGTDMAFPDVCLTPAPPSPSPVPIPYPNIALGPMGTPAAYNILFMGAPAHNMSTVVPLTNGDNPGLATGVASGTVMGPSRHLTAAFTVLVGGMPATRLTSMSLQNSTNAPGARLIPSQVKVLILAP
ncbi:MAG: type VI secretion protein [Deltaproteobacteria bacterium]|nr:MAG: type VI secretion protein [Deltaproteobacteria bacterium]